MMTEEQTKFLGMVKKEARKILAKTLPDATKFWSDNGLSEHVPGRVLHQAYLMGIGAGVTYLLTENAPEKPEAPDADLWLNLEGCMLKCPYPPPGENVLVTADDDIGHRKVFIANHDGDDWRCEDGREFCPSHYWRITHWRHFPPPAES